MKGKLTCLDLFCGAGGLSKGSLTPDMMWFSGLIMMMRH